MTDWRKLLGLKPKEAKPSKFTVQSWSRWEKHCFYPGCTRMCWGADQQTLQEHLINSKWGWVHGDNWYCPSHAGVPGAVVYLNPGEHVFDKDTAMARVKLRQRIAHSDIPFTVYNPGAFTDWMN